MLPSGHIAAGYLVAEAALLILKPDLSPAERSQILFWGAFFGFVPDMDIFYAFYKAKGFILPKKEINHRVYLTHRPFVWLVVSAALYPFAIGSAFAQVFLLMVWLGTWSHFILDSFKVGVMWLWPVSSTFYAFKSPGLREDSSKTTFFKYWFWFLGYYRKSNSTTFYLEILILLTAVTVFVYVH